MKKYDGILYIDNIECINEDDRRVASRGSVGYDKYFQGSTSWDDPKLYSQFSFGQSLKSALNSMGPEWSCNVTDFKKWVVAEIQHHNIITGRTSSKTFLIVFKQKGDGIILSTHNKYRTISGVEQAISYIRSASTSLRDSNQTKL